MAPPDPSVVRIDGPWRHLEVHANGIRFHVVEAQAPESASTPPPLNARWSSCCTGSARSGGHGATSCGA